MATKKAAAKKAPAKKAPATKASARASEAHVAPAAPSGACPRCGTRKFAPEQRTRVDGTRTVRFTILVCERGHTFARPVTPDA